MSWLRKYGVALFLLLSVMAQAQPRLLQPEIYLGVHAGIMGSGVSFTPEVSGMDEVSKALLGPNGGLVFRWSRHKCCGLQVELNYMQRGWREYKKASATTEAFDYSRKLHYIELPFLAHIYFGSPSIRGFVNLGPQIGYCFREEESGTRQTLSTYQYNPIDNRFDWGLAGGLGLYYRTKKAGLFQLEARFNYSFQHLYHPTRKEHFVSSAPMNLSVNFAYLWEFHKKEISIKKRTFKQ